MKINISNRNFKKKHERGLQEQRKKKHEWKLLRVGRNLTVPMLGIENSFQPKLVKCKDLSDKMLLEKLAGHDLKKQLRKSKTCFTSKGVAWEIGLKHSGLNLIEYKKWLASWSLFQINSPKNH